MTDTIDHRVSVLEEFFTDLPEMVNLRFERMNGALSEINVRLNLQDKQLAALTRDVRDMRAGVTRQLIAQDQRLAAQDAMLASHDTRLSAIEAHLATNDTRLGGIETRLGDIEAHLATNDTRLGGIKADIKGVDDKLDQVLRALQAKG